MGEESHFAKLTDDDVIHIRKIYEENSVGRMRVRWGTPTKLAERFGVSVACIKHVASGRTWPHI
jgi:hypothetical protein